MLQEISESSPKITPRTRGLRLTASAFRFVLVAYRRPEAQEIGENVRHEQRVVPLPEKRYKEFITTLQLVSHNFTDPHFIVGPFDDDAWAIVPTSSDLFGTFDGSTFRIGELRAESDALDKGVRPGMRVLLTDGRSPQATIEEITGRSFGLLTSVRVGFAFNVALAGDHGRPRSLELADGANRRTYTLVTTSEQAKRGQDACGNDVCPHRTGRAIERRWCVRQAECHLQGSLTCIDALRVEAVRLREIPSGRRNPDGQEVHVVGVAEGQVLAVEVDRVGQLDDRTRAEIDRAPMSPTHDPHPDARGPESGGKHVLASRSAFNGSAPWTRDVAIRR